jgi:tRNA-modifying protein YgfZ
MPGELRSVPLQMLGVLRVHGTDSASFLQGQLSSDVRRLGADRALLAGYHNPQGRVIALLRVLQLADDELLAILPRELLATVAQRLGKFVLRSKVRLSDTSTQWTLAGLIEPAAAAAAPTGLPEAVNGLGRRAASLIVRVAQRPARWLVVSPVSQPPQFAEASAAHTELWERQAIAAGEPEVYASTSEAFVAQMLNLDALGAIDFDKGCYTGQEIIARAHYRGRVKRRMQRFLTTEAAVAGLEVGHSGVLADGRTFRVVRAATHADGRCEFLAVTAERGANPAGATTLVSAQELELPYSLPD